MTRAAFQANSILRYAVILFWRFFAPRRLSGLMFSSPMNTRRTPARAHFSMKLGSLWQSVSTDDEADIELLGLAQVYQAVEDPLPILVAGKIVVGDEETAHAFGVIEAHDLLDIGGRAVP